MDYNSAYLLIEGRKEALEMLSKHFQDNALVQRLLFIDQTPSKGDIPILIKFYQEVNDVEHLEEYFRTYYDFKKRNIPIKPLNQFNGFIDFSEEVDRVKVAQNNKIPTKTNAKTDDDKDGLIVDDEQVSIYLGDSHERCMTYGKGYSFCISRRDGGMYNSYRIGQQSTFYFCHFKQIPKSNDKHICVIDIRPDKIQWTFADNHTQNTTWADIVKTYPVLEKYKNIFTNKPVTNLERGLLDWTKAMQREQSFELWKDAPIEWKLTFLKSGKLITDDNILFSLTPELLNYHLSAGADLSEHTILKLKDNQKANYLRFRERRLLSGDFSELNSLDESIIESQKTQLRQSEKYVNFVNEIKNRTKNGICDTYIIIKDFNLFLPDLSFIKILKGDFILEESNALISLDGSPQTVMGDFNCSQVKLRSLKGAPKKVSNFICSNNKLTTLEGAPQEVRKNFYCSSNNLTTLEGAPQKVGWEFLCAGNKLTTLKGAPQIIGDFFDCSHNQLTTLEGMPHNVKSLDFSHNKLTTLKGAPPKVNGNFDCSDNSLTSLEGAPSVVSGDFICIGCGLMSLKGAPKSVHDFHCSDNSLTSLEGAPSKVAGGFYCSNNELTSLKGSPQTNDGSFYCHSNKLTTLEGSPQIINYSFDCRRNHLTTLQGSPQKVGKSFDCSDNHLISLDGAPQEVDGDFVFVNNKYLKYSRLTTRVGGRVIKESKRIGSFLGFIKESKKLCTNK